MMPPTELVAHLQRQFEMARYFRTIRQPQNAEPILVELLADSSPEFIKQSALLELAAAAQDQNDLARAQQVYAQFLNKWPDDPRVPEILLRQGSNFRAMCLPTLALTKFYAVMTSALVLKNDQFDYYKRLVLRAQIEIAQTNYQLGNYAEAADCYSRLLEQDNPAIDKAQMLYKLVRCEASLAQSDKVVAHAQEFLAHYGGAPEQPEIRFDLAVALKALKRNTESLQQVLTLLQEQRAHMQDHPDVWAYWQQRCGNLIANQLYREGDYTKALEIYQNLVRLDASPAWQLPVDYQIGMTYEQLWQPEKATATYDAILRRQKDLGTNVPPDLKTIFEMAGWRLHFIRWQNKAEAADQAVRAEKSSAIAASAPAGPSHLQ